MTLSCDGGKMRTHNIVLSKMTLDIAHKNMAFLCVNSHVFPLN